ncbi:hypothetical protein C1646_775393 [Rhizophagus diaphanus]|nr:hypothetical protein C1646_775393 [Rhizophagus diaphanus] [Rhizophagus sp. MUCL 43196]
MLILTFFFVGISVPAWIPNPKDKELVLAWIPNPKDKESVPAWIPNPKDKF